MRWSKNLPSWNSATQEGDLEEMIGGSAIGHDQWEGLRLNGGPFRARSL
jgi:hypothetical protein